MSTAPLLKCCAQCKVEKPLEEFGTQSNGKYGRRGMCKVCYRHKFITQYKANLAKDHRQQYQENRDRRLLSAKKWRDKNQDKLKSPEFKEAQKKYKQEKYSTEKEIISAKMREYYQRHKDKIKERGKQYRMSIVMTEEQRAARKAYRKAHYESNKPESFECAVRRKRTIKQQTPSWAKLERIQEIYWHCIELNKSAGRAAFHVDHIIPLRGKYVSGLHVETNLRVIPAAENLKKGTSHVLGCE